MTSDAVWRYWSRKKYVALTEIELRLHCYPAFNLVSLRIELFRLVKQEELRNNAS
jgi:hypothetical protein